jgi:hypothetical protein
LIDSLLNKDIKNKISIFSKIDKISNPTKIKAKFISLRDLV